jgi:hypothetical protein
MGHGHRRPPTDRIAAYVAALLDRYPDLSADDDEDAEDGSPWSTSPLLGEASGPLVYFPMVYSRAERASAWAAELASQHGLNCSDPQRRQLRSEPIEAWMFELRSERGRSFRDPDAEAIGRVLVRLSKDNYYAVLNRADGWYVQVGVGERAGTRPGWYVLERREGSPDSHFRTESSESPRWFGCSLPLPRTTPPRLNASPGVLLPNSHGRPPSYGLPGSRAWSREPALLPFAYAWLRLPYLYVVIRPCEAPQFRRVVKMGATNLTARLVRGAMAGAVGTAALSLAYRAERGLRHSHKGPLDYDDGTVPGWIVLHDLHLKDAGSAEEVRAGLVLRWTYGSAFGVAHGMLRRRLPEPAATIVFGSVLMAATFTLFPMLGRTPRPWRWPIDVLATSVVTHALYAAAVGGVDRVKIPAEDAVMPIRSSPRRWGPRHRSMRSQPGERQVTTRTGH